MHAALASTDRRRIITAGSIAALVGGVSAASPLAAVVLAAGAAIVLLVALGRNVIPLFHVALAASLLGYAALNRGYAYIGIGGLYVGELLVGLALFAIVAQLSRARIQMAHLALGAFIAWGAIRTIPYVGEYGIDALRDSVAWAYAVIGVALSLTVSASALRTAVRWYERLALPLVLWLPLAAIAVVTLQDRIPAVPGTDQSIIYFKAGDAGVHLAGVAAFLLVGLGLPAGRSSIRLVFTWAAWLLALGLVAAVNRGGMLSAASAGLAVVIVRRISPVVLAGCVALSMASAAWLANPTIEAGFARPISFQQIAENVMTIFQDRPGAQPQGTKEWRFDWWERIVGYTVYGPYFWDGKGYGVNLADDDGFQVEEDKSLRSPHSAHLEILARSGVVGLALWVALQATVWLSLLRALARAWAQRAKWWLAVVAWLGSYWVATLINMSVDVYLAGPMGGILHWTLVGIIISLDRLISDDSAKPPANRQSVLADAGVWREGTSG